MGRHMAQLATQIGLVQATTGGSAGNYFSASLHYVGTSCK